MAKKTGRIKTSKKSALHVAKGKEPKAGDPELRIKEAGRVVRSLKNHSPEEARAILSLARQSHEKQYPY